MIKLKKDLFEFKTFEEIDQMNPDELKVEFGRIQNMRDRLDEYFEHFVLEHQYFRKDIYYCGECLRIWSYEVENE